MAHPQSWMKRKVSSLLRTLRPSGGRHDRKDAISVGSKRAPDRFRSHYKLAPPLIVGFRVAGFHAPRSYSHYRDRIVVEDGRNVFGGELVCRVGDKKTCLADRTVTDNDTPGIHAMVSQQCPRERRTVEKRRGRQEILLNGCYYHLDYLLKRCEGLRLVPHKQICREVGMFCDRSQ